MSPHFAAARRYDLAKRDAAIERGEPEREPVPAREPASVRVWVDGQPFDAIGKPARRCNQFVWVLNGEQVGRGGLEHVWREIQCRRVRLLGERNLL
jgi:hypothetical protein